ncbi:unnamed protein product [Zymoseptoria tritici ST99CH_1E4]|uniref:RecF/RecN/SMC N-terminal domain-containing protein n=1 Tax=Zymoseptoria tritici ST99CH_1E4 TaxID=1276532 RepID=A0A2H1H3G7_ZYMTR|nr:unnamed protein product [Zymoseptoria tritici ST99CH_1E4]
MSHRKRSRATDDDGSPEVEIESANSSFRQNHNKRSRVTLASERGGSVVSDEEDYLAGFEDGPEEEDYTMHQDSSDDELEEDNLDEAHATQIVTKQMNQYNENLASEQGVIQEVYCRNFMCHSNLRVKFGPLINFIIGHNGSGKSAVLTALQVCLGGRAVGTNRGKSMKDMIKEGQESATLAVKIKNEGEDAYKPDIYGVSITVERHFSKSGSSGFRLKNDQDKIISNKKSDVDDMLDYFALQLDNPINVLTQDMARAFLSNSTPSEKYRFFIRGTQLEMLDQDYKLTEERLDNTQEKLRLRQDDIAVLKSKAQKAEERKKQLDRAASIQTKIEETARVHAWAQVKEEENLLAGCEQDVSNKEAEVRELEEAAQAVSDTHEAHVSAKEAAERAVEALREALPPLEEASTDAEAKFIKNKDDLTAAHRESRTIRDSIKKAKADVRRLQGHVTDEEARLAGAAGDAHTARLNQLEELRENAQAAKREHKEHCDRKADIDKACTLAQARYDAAQPVEQKARQALDSAKRGKEQLERGQGRPFAPYDRNMERLLKEMDRETRWKVKPVGPMGFHISLLRPEWSPILEKVFGGALGGFVVANRSDQDLLSNIMRRVGCGPIPIFICPKTEPLDMTDKEPPAGVETILRVLRIDNTMVLNQLIISNYIDTTCLVKGLKEATAFMYPEHGPQRHHRVKATIALVKPGHGTRLDVSRSNQPKSTPVHPWNGPSRMKVDQAEQLALQERNIRDAARELTEAQQNATQLRDALTKAKQAVTAFKQQEAKLRTAAQKAEDAVEALESEIESNRPQDGKLQALQEQLTEAQNEQKAQEDAFEDSVIAKDKLDEVANELKPDLEEKQMALQLQKERIAKAEKKLERCETLRTDALWVKNEAIAKVESAKGHVERLEAKRDKQKARVEEFVGYAEEVCARVPVTASVQELDERLETLKAQYKEEQKRAGGSREELTLAYVQAHKAYSDAKNQTESLTETSRLLQKSLRERRRRWGLFRKYITVRARLNFSYLLQERAFRGHVLMNHAEKKLDIVVEPDPTKSSMAGRQARTLSGGEKSFSTICLLLSIWEAMGSPIRCLDEFDVFMDSVNRTQSMAMMIQAARRAVGRQFILITPQAMGNVEMGDDVKIHKMRDPERAREPGQAGLPFAAEA